MSTLLAVARAQITAPVNHPSLCTGNCANTHPQNSFSFRARWSRSGQPVSHCPCCDGGCEKRREFALTPARCKLRCRKKKIGQFFQAVEPRTSAKMDTWCLLRYGLSAGGCMAIAKMIPSEIELQPRTIAVKLIDRKASPRLPFAVTPMDILYQITRWLFCPREIQDQLAQTDRCKMSLHARQITRAARSLVTRKCATCVLRIRATGRTNE